MEMEREDKIYATMQRVERLAKMLKHKDEIIMGLNSDRQLGHLAEIRSLVESKKSGYV